MNSACSLPEFQGMKLEFHWTKLLFHALERFHIVREFLNLFSVFFPVLIRHIARYAPHKNK